MSESKLVDGKTGELIGNYYTSGNYVNTTTSNYVPASTYAYGSSSGAGNAAQTVAYSTQPASQTVYTTNYQPGYSVNGGNYAVSGGNYAVSGAVGGSRTQVAGGQQIVSGQQVVGGQVVGTTVNTGKEVIKGESRIEYVPFEKKIVEYKDQAKVERVPKKVKKVEYREERKIETIPKEVTVTDYYAVEYLRQYIPQYVPEKRIEYVQVPKKQVRYEYIPVERQIVHYPDQPLEVERGVSGSQVAGQVVQGGYTTQTGQVVQGGYTTQTGQVVQGGYTTQGGQAVQGGYTTQGGYVSGQSGAGYSNAVQAGQTYTTGQSGYVTGGQSYTTVQPSEKLYSANTVYTTGPVQTTYEYVNAPSSANYVDYQGQRWESTHPYAGEYEYVSPEGYTTQQK